MYRFLHMIYHRRVHVLQNLRIGAFSLVVVGLPVVTMTRASAQDSPFPADSALSEIQHHIRGEVMPYLKNGHFAVLSNMGHMDVIKLQRQAFEHMVSRFFFEGVVDTSQYVPNRIDFSPAETYQGYAERLFPEK